MIILDNEHFIGYRCKIMMIERLLLCYKINITLIGKKL